MGADITAAHDRLVARDANLGERQDILELAASLATRRGDAYAKASDHTRKQFNAAVFERIDVKGGCLASTSRLSATSLLAHARDDLAAARQTIADASTAPGTADVRPGRAPNRRATPGAWSRLVRIAATRQPARRGSRWRRGKAPPLGT
jgi:hypothetical protein